MKHTKALNMKKEIGDSDIYLEQIVTEYDNGSEASALNTLVSYVELINEEDNNFMMELTEKLSAMDVSWYQPWYQNTKCLTRRFKKENEGDGVPEYHTDRITKVESDLLDKNWKMFVKEYDVPNKPECFARWRNRDNDRRIYSPVEQVRHFVTAYLAQGLKRTLPQVYRHFVNKYAYTNKGPCTENEEKIIKLCFAHNPGNAVMALSTILRRESRMIYNKQKSVHKSPPERRKPKRWTLERATKFLQCLMQYSNLPLKKLRYKKFPSDVWHKLEKDMDHPRDLLRKFWYEKLHIQLYVKESTKLRSITKKVYKVLKYSSYKVWTDIRWKEVLEYFPSGYTPAFLNLLARRIFRWNRHGIKLPVQELVPLAYKTLKQHRKNKRLLKLKMNVKGELVFYDPSENDSLPEQK